jgi:hypothetical protein
MVKVAPTMSATGVSQGLFGRAATLFGSSSTVASVLTVVPRTGPSFPQSNFIPVLCNGPPTR